MAENKYGGDSGRGLSAKIVFCTCMKNPEDWIHQSDVKEFIKELKDARCICKADYKCAFCQKLDKLAGPELI